MRNKITMTVWLAFGLALSSQAIAQNADKALASSHDWKSSPAIPGASDRFTRASSVHLSLTPVSDTQALQRMPFYVTAPYWLPRSRPFNASNNLAAPQRSTHGALINDIAALVRSPD
jgi:hypothetical protein